MKVRRAASATIEALFVDTGRDVSAADRAALEHLYGVAVEVGYLPISQQDWDDRTRLGCNPNLSSLAELGIFPPFAAVHPERMAGGRPRA